MKQGLLPLVPSGAIEIDGLYNITNDGKKVVWFQGCNPIRMHPVTDHATQRSMMAILHVHGNVPQAKIARSLGVHENTVRSAVKLYREKGDLGFYAPSGVRGASVMTTEVLEECRRLLQEGYSRSETAEALGIKKCNIDKAVQKGQLPSSILKDIKKKSYSF